LTEEQAKLGDELEGWLSGAGERTVGSLLDLFGQRAFAILFVLLLAVPALPIPTGGATHVFELIAMLVSLQLLIGRREIWLPQRWRRIQLSGGRRERFLNALMRLIRRLERFSRPRLAFLFGNRVANALFGLLVIGLSVAAFVAPPFTGLDTLPALGAVVLSLGFLLKDILVVAGGIVVGATGVVLELALGAAVWKIL
jgi:hypothetical protein